VRTAYPWLIDPIFDYMLSCGGLVWILFGVHYCLLGGSDHGRVAAGLINLSAIGALFIAEGHTAASLIRTYESKTLRDGLPLYTRWLPTFLIVLAVVAATFGGVTPILLKVYLLMVPYHFMMQSYGVARLYCLKNGYHLSRFEIWALLMVALSTVSFAIVKQLTYKEWSGVQFLHQRIPFWGPLPEPIMVVAQTLLVSSLILLGGIIVERSIRRKQFFPLPALLTMATGIAAFTMGQMATGIFWLYVSAFFHGTQYLMIVVACRLKEGGGEWQSPSRRAASLIRNSPATKLLGMILLVSVFLYIGVPEILGRFGLDLQWTVAVVFLIINIHHILLDGVLWRLRSPGLRQAVE
jgi:hypothetical protein